MELKVILTVVSFWIISVIPSVYGSQAALKHQIEAIAAAAAGCPDYAVYSTRVHQPLSLGELKLGYQRPNPICRTFHSDMVESIIKTYKSKLKDLDIARLFENCFPNTLDTTIRWHLKGKTPQTFVVTGDINAEWLRDSTYQLSVYQPYSPDDDNIKNLIKGAINTQAEFIIKSPYCNAFQPPLDSHLKPSTNGMNDIVHPTFDPSTVFECKYELDSLASFLDLSTKYFEVNNDSSFVDNKWLDAFQNIWRVIQEQSYSTFDATTGIERRPYYSFQRWTDTGTETLSLRGAGNPTNANTSLIKSAFRPSDDATIFQFFIPANAYMSVQLKKTAALFEACGMKQVAQQVKEKSIQLEEAIWEFGTYEHAVYGKVFAYEVDGYGSILNMDDANLPSLLSLPLMGFLDIDNQVYQNTRKMILNRQGNPYYLDGWSFSGIGGPHIGIRYAWPMSLLTQIRTTNDDDEILDLLQRVKKTTSGLGLMHESVNIYNSNDYTRSWFAWCNSEFGKTIVDLANRKPHLIFKD